jgi:isopenicillin N synthase-like dioxygenase
MRDAVPTLDAGSTENTRFAHDLSAAYEEYGFVIIQNHGIDKRVIDQCLACFQRFFALPEAEKRRYQVPGGGGARGYTPFGIETAKGATHPVTGTQRTWRLTSGWKASQDSGNRRSLYMSPSMRWAGASWLPSRARWDLDASTSTAR